MLPNFLAWYWDYGNGTTIYFSSEPNWQCGADFRSDIDIGGPGVIIAFTVTAWVTCFVAVLAAYCNAWDLLHMTMQSFSNSRFLQNASVFLRPETTETAQSQFVSKRVLDSLCDLQIITGTAILIAGLSQCPDITVYHEQLVISYWSFTLNSFWAARAGDFLNDPDREIWYIQIRTAVIFCSVVLAVVYQSFAIRREEWHQTSQWDPFTSGFCFRTHDNLGLGQNLMWITGLACYATYLAVFLLSTRSGGTSCLSQFGTNIKALEIMTIRRYIGLVDESLNGLSGGNGWRCISAEILKGLSYIPIILWWLLLAWCALWSVGSESPILVIAYWGFAAWNTYDIIDYKLSNRPLLQSPESPWGFGQVLPVVLMASIVISILDALTEARRKFQQKEARAQPQVGDAINLHETAPALNVQVQHEKVEGA